MQEQPTSMDISSVVSKPITVLSKRINKPKKPKPVPLSASGRRPAGEQDLNVTVGFSPFSQEFRIRPSLMGLKSAHFQESGFQGSGEGDRFWKMVAHSLGNGLCIKWSGFYQCPPYLWHTVANNTCCTVVKQTSDQQITHGLVAQTLVPAAGMIPSQIQDVDDGG